MKTLVLGVGNPLAGDDAVGLEVAGKVKLRLAGRADVDVEEDCRGGLRLMERMIGYDRAVLIDAVSSGAAPGTIVCLRPEDVPLGKSVSSHGVELPAALELGRQAGIELPGDQQIVVVGIEAEHPVTFGKPCTPAVSAAVPQAVDLVLRILSTTAQGL